MVKRTNKAPSRRKYEEANPVLSFRVPRKIYEELRMVKGSTGESRTKVLMAGLGLYKVKIKTEKEIWQKAYDQGVEKGRQEVWDLLAVNYPCSICGKEITVHTEEEKKAIRKFMTESGWHHGDCESR